MQSGFYEISQLGRMRLGNGILMLAVLLISASCQPAGRSKADFSQRPVRIVTTTGMIGDAAKIVAGEWADVVSLMGPGIDPHLYKASEGDVTLMAEADLILYNGVHLEGRMTRVFEKMEGRANTIAVGEAVPESLLVPVQGGNGSHDPHIWFDVRVWMYVVDAIGEGLAQLDTLHSADYRKNAAAYHDSLITLDAWVRKRVNEIPESTRVLITAHDAFRYFGHAYGVEVRGLQGISTATEAGTGDVRGLADFIVQRKIPAIYVESSVPPRTIEAVKAAVRDRGFEVNIGGELFGDAMGDAGTSEGTYLGMVRHNVNTIVGGLKGETVDSGWKE